MGPIKIQDVQNAVTLSQNRILQQLPPRQEMLLLTNNVKTLMTLAQQNQQFLRQAEIQRLQATRRVVSLEARIAQLEQEVRWNRALLEKMSNRPVQPQTVVVAPTQDQDGYTYAG